MTRAICSGLLVAACSAGCSAPGPSLRDQVVSGQQAFVRGDVLQAYRTMRAIDQTLIANEPAELRTDYEQLLAQVTRATEHLVERWLEIGGAWTDQGDLIQALAYYDDLLARLPRQDDLHTLLAEESRPLRDRLEQLRSELKTLVKEARRQLGHGHTEKAHQILLEARWLAEQNLLTFGLDNERLLAECDRRLPGYLEDLEEASPPDPSSDPAVKPTPRPKTRPRRIRRPRPAARPRPLATGGAVAAPKKKANRLFDRGQRQVEQGRKIAAIKTFLKLLRSVPDHAGAKAALKRLEPARRRQVDAWMEQASEHFAREELDKAAPFYRKVLEIEPDNLRAKEGWQMYLRLLELKKKQR